MKNSLAAKPLNAISTEKILQIFKAYTPLLKKASNKTHLLPLKDDAFATARCALLKAIRNYDPKRGIPFAGYAKKIVYGEVHTLFKKERHKWEKELLTPPTAKKEDIDPLHNFPAKVNLEKLADYESLKEALQKLSKKEKSLLKSLYFDDRTQQEIARTRGVTQQAIAKQKTHILKKLHEFLS